MSWALRLGAEVRRWPHEDGVRTGIGRHPAGVDGGPRGFPPGPRDEPSVVGHDVPQPLQHRAQRIFVQMLMLDTQLGHGRLHVELTLRVSRPILT